jgi:hypothetical protein
MEKVFSIRGDNATFGGSILTLCGGIGIIGSGIIGSEITGSGSSGGNNLTVGFLAMGLGGGVNGARV